MFHYTVYTIFMFRFDIVSFFNWFSSKTIPRKITEQVQDREFFENNFTTYMKLIEDVFLFFVTLKFGVAFYFYVQINDDQLTAAAYFVSEYYCVIYAIGHKIDSVKSKISTPLLI